MNQGKRIGKGLLEAGLISALIVSVGCAGETQMGVDTPPPPPPQPVAAPPPPPPAPPAPAPEPVPEGPETRTEHTHVTADHVEISEKVKFETGSAKINPESDDLLEEIAGVLNRFPELDYIEIAGHADVRGSKAQNKQLTQARAQAVVDELVKDGVDGKRLRAVGYGSYCPVDEGNTDEAHTKNRRVEIVILRRAGADLPVDWGGCHGATVAGMKPMPIPETAPKSTPKPVAAVRPKRVPGKVVRTGTIVTLPDDIHFAPDSAKLDAHDEKILGLLEDFLAENTDITKMRIEGHAAAKKNNPGLEKLSADRAAAVVGWLVKNGIEHDRVFAVGCGAKRLIDGDDGKPDMKISKRTEAHVVETNGELEPSEPVVPGDCTAVHDMHH